MGNLCLTVGSFLNSLCQIDLHMNSPGFMRYEMARNDWGKERKGLQCSVGHVLSEKLHKMSEATTEVCSNPEPSEVHQPGKANATIATWTFIHK